MRGLIKWMSRLDQMDARFDQMDGRLDQMDARFEKLEARMGTMEARMGTMERQQAKLEGLLEGLARSHIWPGTRQPLNLIAAIQKVFSFIYRTLFMTRTFTCTQARDRLASLCKDVTDDSDYVIITRPGHEDVALISASELSSLIETAHLLSSPKNAETTGNSTKSSKSRYRTRSIH